MYNLYVWEGGKHIFLGTISIIPPSNYADTVRVVTPMSNNILLLLILYFYLLLCVNSTQEFAEYNDL